MSVYVYESPSGDVIEREFRMGRAPQTIVVDGKRCKRVFTAPRVSIARDVGHIATNFPDSHVKYHKGDTVIQDGRKVPLIRDASQIDRIERAAAADGNPLYYAHRK